MACMEHLAKDCRMSNDVLFQHMLAPHLVLKQNKYPLPPQTVRVLLIVGAAMEWTAQLKMPLGNHWP